jgi:ABC-type sugar transport system permease subunit
MGAGLLLNNHYKGVKFYSSLLMIPWFIPSVVASLIWSWILHDQFGIFNQVLGSFGLIDNNIAWLSDKTLALIAVILVDAWVGLPFMTVVFLGALKTVPNELLEAAIVDELSILRTAYLSCPINSEKMTN